MPRSRQSTSARQGADTAQLSGALEDGSAANDGVSAPQAGARRDIDLRRLRFFLEVADRGGFSSAAHSLFSTQSTVSKAVRQLERELGTELMQRGGGGVRLTPAGVLVRDRGRHLVASADDLVTSVQELQGTGRAKLRIGCPRMGMSSLFAKTCVAFRLRHPGVDIDLVSLPPASLEARLRAGDLDVAVWMGAVPADLASRPYRTESLLALLPKSSPLAAGSAVTVEQLCGMPLILFEHACPVNEAIVARFAQAGGAPKVALHTSNLEYAYELVAAGVGVAFASHSAVQYHTHGAVAALRIVGDEWSCQLSHAWRRRPRLPPAVQAWLDLCSSPADA